MKQILVISGKGGTGKTVVSGAMAALADGGVIVDCDVDAADLHLLLHPVIKERNEFRSGHTAVIDKKLCKKCGKCLRACRFNAISPDFNIESFSCEGCRLCGFVCPHGAIRMEENLSGEWYISDTKYGPFVHARLGIAAENSGKLVSKIRRAAGELAAALNKRYVIIDGPPGIGCPVIASLSGVDLALVVTEPTLSGLCDAKRVMELAKYFNVPVSLVINKFDLNPDMSDKIEFFCGENSIVVAGKIPFDPQVVMSVVEGKTIIEYSGTAVKEQLAGIWEKIR